MNSVAVLPRTVEKRNSGSDREMTVSENSLEKRLRVVEAVCGSCEPVQMERWRVQLDLNEKCEGRMEQLESCVRELKTTIKVNNTKVGLIFFVVQVVVSGVLIAVMTQIMNR